MAVEVFQCNWGSSIKSFLSARSQEKLFLQIDDTKGDAVKIAGKAYICNEEGKNEYISTFDFPAKDIRGAKKGEFQGNDALVIVARVASLYGAKMQKDFESVIERRIHTWFNYIEGLMHTGQRNLFRIRISKDSFNAGLRLRDLGEVLYGMIMDEFGSVVDKCQVTLVTDKEKVEKILEEEAMPVYRFRDNRLSSLSDESVDQYYTCILCQSFAPAHCCVVTPERLGLCGAVSWLDAKATYELNATGPSQPIPKEGLIDERLGKYESVNKMVAQATHGAVENVSLYSLIEDPMTSCGCFECTRPSLHRFQEVHKR